MELKGIELKFGMILESKLCKYVMLNNHILAPGVNMKMPLDYFLDQYGEKVIKITYGDKVLYEQNGILDDKEKEYLSNVIKPFRDKVRFIQKLPFFKNEYILINLNNDSITLPCFEKRTMYKGMKLEKGYELEELGL